MFFNVLFFLSFAWAAGVAGWLSALTHSREALVYNYQQTENPNRIYLSAVDSLTERYRRVALFTRRWYKRNVYRSSEEGKKNSKKKIRTSTGRSI